MINQGAKVICTAVFLCAYLISCSYVPGISKSTPPAVKESAKPAEVKNAPLQSSENKKKDEVPENVAKQLKDHEQKNEAQLKSIDEEGKLSGEAFRKHDHAKYSEQVKKSALELMAKLPDAVLVRMCKDTITETWSMQAYYFGAKEFWFLSYTWDEIDEKWEESFKSDKRPISAWKNHVNFSASGRECQTLKGADKLK